MLISESEQLKNQVEDQQAQIKKLKEEKQALIKELEHLKNKVNDFFVESERTSDIINNMPHFLVDLVGR